jgi:hypothetical protein
LPVWRFLCNSFLASAIAVLGISCSKPVTELELLLEASSAQLERNNPVVFELSPPDEGAILVEVEGFETAFTSNVITAHGDTLSSARQARCCREHFHRLLLKLTTQDGEMPSKKCREGP